MVKLPRAELAAAVGAYDRILAISTEIREPLGLAPVGDGQTIGAARARLAAFKQPRAKVKVKKAKRRGPSVTALRAQLKASQSEVAELIELVGLLQRREPTAV
jgi:hypothetical protein